MLKLDYFYFIIEIAKVGSISGAAQNLYISQPYLSQSLKRTEDILGITIFNRTNKGVVPTDAGQELISLSYNIIELIDQSKDLKRKYSDKVRKFSITTMPSFTMLDLIQDFKSIHGKDFSSCTISYHELPNTFIADRVKEGDTDIGLVYTTSTEHEAYVSKVTEMSLNYVELVEEPVYAIVSKENELYARDEIEFKDLKDLHFLVETIDLYKNSPPVENNLFPEIFKTRGNHNLKFNNNRSMMHFLSKRSDCYSIGQKSLNLTNPSVLSGELKYIPITDLQVHLNLGFLTNENLESSQIQEIFISYIEDYFRNQINSD